MVSIDGFYFTYDTIIESLIIASGSKLTSFIGKYTVTAWNPIIDGIDLLNNLFFQDRLFIHESVGDSFIEELESYHRKRDKNDNILNAVADGQVDHRVDSLRYAIATLYKGSKNRY